MLRWSLGFFIVAIISAIFGFGDLAGASCDIGKVLFFFFLINFLFSLIWGLFSGSKWKPPKY